VSKKFYDYVMKEYNIEDEPIEFLINMIFNKSIIGNERKDILYNKYLHRPEAYKIIGNEIKIVGTLYRNKEGRIELDEFSSYKDVPSIVRFFHDDEYEDPVVEYNNIQKAKEEDTKKEGSGFNKKQLRQIILDKNKVIGDLEETAYGGNYNPHSYLDNILDNNTTSQNRVILSEKIGSVPKYIKSLNLEI
jgi:hypothetical protein